MEPFYLRDTRGFSLTSMLAGVAILGIVAVGINQMIIVMTSRSQQSITRSNISLMRDDFVALIGNQAVWDQTKSKNPSMQCLINKSCTNGSGGKFSIYDSSGAVAYDSLNPSAGFTLDGRSCTTYSDSGNDGCPLRFELSWTASCNDGAAPGSCRYPTELVTVAFKFSPHSAQMKNSLILNPAKFSIVNQARLNMTTSTPVVDCASQGKIFIGQGNSFQGSNADSLGCVALATFTGPRGAAGPLGAAGPQGPPGPAGVCL
ncbi:MAG: type II secretion system protein [Pseudobdellovibrionaceae bacterium]